MFDLPAEQSFRPELDLATDSGVIRFGPLKASCAGEIRALMQEFGLSTGGDQDLRIESAGHDAVFLIAAGEGVTGYFLEEFGIEAAIESVDALVLRCCAIGAPVSIRGHYFPDDETRIATLMTAVHDGAHVTWCHVRARIRGGEILRLEGAEGQRGFPMVSCSPRPLTPALRADTEHLHGRVTA
ncbi:hypothetical protein [Leisingera caerulea]|uniref:hypothetical protein n=1 Tax=Leisingera caerulea TaxID=506591 RepID=UPI00041C99E1|nr:hypothetical protein [Leisingera caerulea]